MSKLYLTTAEHSTLLGISETTPDGLTAIEVLETECDFEIVVDSKLAVAHRNKLAAMGKPVDLVIVQARTLDRVLALSVASSGNAALQKMTGILDEPFPVLLCPFVTPFPSAPNEANGGEQLFLNLTGLAKPGQERRIHVTIDSDGATALSDIWLVADASGNAQGYIPVPAVGSPTQMTLGIAQAIRVDYELTTAGGGSYAGVAQPIQWLMYDKISILVKP